METMGGGIIKRHSLLVVLIICFMAISTMGSSYALADNQQLAENIVDSALNNNTTNNQNPVETVNSNQAETQVTAQSTWNMIGATENDETQNNKDNTKDPLGTGSTSQNSASTGTNTQNAVQTAGNNSVNSANTSLTDSVNNTTKTQELQAAAGDTYTNIRGIWLRAEDAGNITVSEMKSANITDIFVKANLISIPTYQSILSGIISKFNDSGIRIHAWITCFKDADGNWINPANATQQTILQNAIKDVVKNYNVDGILLDYVRYSGIGTNTASNHNGTAVITSFVQKIYNTVKSIKPKVAVSVAVMPEGTTNANTYGQDYTQLAKYVDFLVPMIYKGNYGKNTTWIATTTKYIVDHAGGKPVIVALQTYVSDYDRTQLSADELNQDIKSAANNGASGYSLYRYGAISQSFLKPPSFTMADIQNAAAKVKSYIETNKKLPNYVAIGSTQVTMPEFLRLMVAGLLQINSKKTTPITLKNVDKPQNSTGSFKKGNINKASYLDIAQKIKSFIDSNGIAPNYATTSLGKVQFEQLVYMYSKILNYYNTKKALPNYVSMDPAVKVSASSGGPQTTTVFTVDQIKSAAANIKSYIETNHELPNYATVGSVQVKMTDFLRLLLIATIEINEGSRASISLKTVNAAATPSESITSGNITQDDYVDLANRVKTFIDTNGALPNHATTPLGEIKFESMVYMYSKILGYYNTNSRLPNYVSVDSWSKVTTVDIPAELQQYLQVTKNCQVNDASIKALAASITKGKTSAYDKAVAIFNWVRDNIGYEFYYNTKYGAVGTLNAKKGNCVDTSHLLIALSRAAGIPARYRHGTCTFTSGSTYGHVWAQIWVNGKWYSADATSSKNTFGVINNWNTATYTLKGTYASLSF